MAWFRNVVGLLLANERRLMRWQLVVQGWWDNI